MVRMVDKFRTHGLDVRMWAYLFASFALFCGYSVWAQGKAKPAAGSAPNYARDIRPILQDRCVVCHSASTLNAPAVSGGLALDSFDAVKKGVVGKDGAKAIFVAGKSAEGELMARLTATSPTKLMPKGGPALSSAQIALFKRWIEAGAPAGDAPSGATNVKLASPVVPMPANPAAQDVRFATLLKPAPDMLDKDAPKDAALAFALKVGPLPPITALAYSPDGKRLAVGSYRAVTFWDTTAGQPVACLTHLAGPVQALAYRADGTQIAVAGGSPGAKGDVRIYDTKTLAPVGPTLEGHTDVVLSVAWNNDGTRLATASQDKSARLWEWPSGKELKAFKDHGDAVTRVAFSPDGKSLYTGSMDHNVRRFDCDKGTVVRVFTGHNEGVIALAVNGDGKRVVSSGTEAPLRWWNTDTGDTTNNNGGHNGPVNDMVFSKDGKTLVSASADKTVRVWDGIGTGQQRALEGATDWLYTVAISPDAKFTAGAGAEGIIRIWETANGRLRLMLLQWPGEKPLPEWAVFTPEGFYDASAGWASGLHPVVGTQPGHAPRLLDWTKALHQPESVVKAWQGAPLDAAKPPAAPAPPPATKPTTTPMPSKSTAPTTPNKSSTPPKK